MENADSTVRCACRAVHLRFPEVAPRFRIHCCCVDCLQKAEWATTVCGGPRLPEGVLALRQPMDLIYFGNRLEVVSGREHLQFFRLRVDSGSTNCVTACCGTTILVDHTCYRGKCLLLFPDLVELETVLYPPSYVNDACDWPDAKVAELPSAPPIGKQVEDADGRSWSSRNHAEPPAAFEGSATFSELLAGRVPEVLGLVKGSQSQRLRR